MPMIPFVKSGCYASRNWTPLVNGNGDGVAERDGVPLEYKRLIGFEFNADCYFVITDFHLKGSDTVRLSFSVDKACNVFGCYTTNDATDNYSLYMSTTSGSKYLRYDGSTYNSAIASAQLGDRLDVVISPTGTDGMPTESTMTPQTFEASVSMCIGTTSTGASSSKLDGNIWGEFVVDGRIDLIPVERVDDGMLGYYDGVSGTFYAPSVGTPTSLGYA